MNVCLWFILYVLRSSREFDFKTAYKFCRNKQADIQKIPLKEWFSLCRTQFLRSGLFGMSGFVIPKRNHWWYRKEIKIQKTPDIKSSQPLLFMPGFLLDHRTVLTVMARTKLLKSNEINFNTGGPQIDGVKPQMINGVTPLGVLRQIKNVIMELIVNDHR